MKTDPSYDAHRLIDGLVAATLFGTILGLVDFFLFETQGQRPAVHELVFSKPKFWSMSLLSYQVFTLALVAISLYFFWFIFSIFIAKKSKFSVPVSPLMLTAISICLLIMTLRLLKNSHQPPKLIVLTIIMIVLIIVIQVFERSNSRNINHAGSAIPNIGFLQRSAAATCLLVIPFLAPDIISISSRYSSKYENINVALPNVLLIVLDTVRVDHLSCYGYRKSETPNIDRIAQNGFLFRNAFSTAPWTLPSHASMFTGLYPSQHHADMTHQHLASDYFTLAEYLQGLGYRTVGFSENPYLGVNHGLEQGFMEFHEPWRHPMIVRAFNELATMSGLRKIRHEFADRTSESFRRWIIDGADDGRPFFAYINFMAAHLPRYPRTPLDASPWSAETLRRIEPINLVPERYYLDKYRIDDSDLTVMREIYDQEISHIDKNVGEIFDFLNESGVIENTILIMTSDHGENFGDHGFIEHTLCLYNSLTHVPLIILLPDENVPMEIQKNVSTAGLFLTIADLLNLRPGAEIIPNIESMVPSILRTQHDQAIISEHANTLKMMKNVIYKEAPDHDFSRYDRDLKSLIIGDYKYIWYSTGREELYDIKSDPFEVQDIASCEPQIVERFREILQESTHAGSRHTRSETVPQIDAATRDALRALGYEN